MVPGNATGSGSASVWGLGGVIKAITSATDLKVLVDGPLDGGCLNASAQPPVPSTASLSSASDTSPFASQSQNQNQLLTPSLPAPPVAISGALSGGVVGGIAFSHASLSQQAASFLSAPPNAHAHTPYGQAYGQPYKPTEGDLPPAPVSASMSAPSPYGSAPSAYVNHPNQSSLPPRAPGVTANANLPNAPSQFGYNPTPMTHPFIQAPPANAQSQSQMQSQMQSNNQVQPFGMSQVPPYGTSDGAAQTAASPFPGFPSSGNVMAEVNAPSPAPTLTSTSTSTTVSASAAASVAASSTSSASTTSKGDKSKDSEVAPAASGLVGTVS